MSAPIRSRTIARVSPGPFSLAGAGSVGASLRVMEDSASREVMPAISPRREGAAVVAALTRLRRDLLEGRIRRRDGQALVHPFFRAELVVFGAGRAADPIPASTPTSR